MLAVAHHYARKLPGSVGEAVEVARQLHAPQLKVTLVCWISSHIRNSSPERTRSAILPPLVPDPAHLCTSPFGRGIGYSPPPLKVGGAPTALCVKLLYSSQLPVRLILRSQDTW